MLGHTELNQLDVLRIVRRGSPTESEKGLIIPSVKSPSLEEISVEHKTRSDKVRKEKVVRNTCSETLPRLTDGLTAALASIVHVKRVVIFLR